MNIHNIHIRTASPDDAPALLAIYAPYVTDTAITFEYTVPTLEEFRQRILHTLQSYPYLVAQEADGTILGYALASPFNERAAYAWNAETTIYLAPEARGHGLGRTLYFALEEALRAQNVLNLNACIAYPEREDEYLTKNSYQFHSHLGYTLVGEFHQCGFKFGRWYNMIWMEKHLGDHTDDPRPFIPFPLL